jgi:nitronate monooxygenase
LDRNDRLAPEISRFLRIPLIAAPMLGISGPDLVVAACSAGIVGAFPTANARTVEELDLWLSRMTSALQGRQAGPICPNIIVRSERAEDDIACIARHGVKMVITSVGSPKPFLPRLHDAGVQVFADVATLAHAEKAAAAGADGLVLLTAGAGGQTGWMNPFAYVRAVRRVFDGPIVLAGGVSDGVALRAARILGCDLAYMGTKMIATRESMASDAYRRMLVESSLDDVMQTAAFSGLPSNMLKPSILRAGLDPGTLDEQISADEARLSYGGGAQGPRRWRDIWSAGHSVSGVFEVTTVAELVDRTAAEYAAAENK